MVYLFSLLVLILIKCDVTKQYTKQQNNTDFPDWKIPVRIHVTMSSVSVCRLSLTAPLVFASLDCLQNISISRTQSLLSSKKSHSVHQGETQQLALTSGVIQPQNTLNKQSSEHSNCFVQLICNTCVICIESTCQQAALS